ncbi:hypothetical protein [Methylobacterium sp. Leaf117]|uniref:hypothetical protein n=1 Tax=Methylobacterium sp. Leaf117 TaxID=1736260 RepID=UPI0006FBFFD3|nr:hypothetical protein [Methylobacterium sp. Leaf117]KQP89387.1 hypothetical protein ASF57_23800 [Methylobacterium sp. Leaf117]
MTSSFFRASEVNALVVAKRPPVMDVEKIARHTDLYAQQAGAHGVSQARKAGGMAAMRYIIGVKFAKNINKWK